VSSCGFSFPGFTECRQQDSSTAPAGGDPPAGVRASASSRVLFGAVNLGGAAASSLWKQEAPGMSASLP
jgi:hypothetical protein